MSKFKNFPCLCIISGIVVGALYALNVKNELKGAYTSHSSSFMQGPHGKIIYETPLITIHLSNDNFYELRYLILNEKVGFIATGTHKSESNHLSLYPNTHEKILPNRKLSFFEQILLSEDTILAHKNMRYIPINKDTFFLIGAYKIFPFYRNSSPYSG